MIVKLCSAGVSHSYQCDMVSTEVIELGTRVIAYCDRVVVVDVVVSDSDETKPSRAYVMEGGVTVDTIK